MNKVKYFLITTSSVLFLENTTYGSELVAKNQDNILERIYIPNAEFFTKFIGSRKIVEFDYMHPLLYVDNIYQ